jgi:hypothetical protein
LGKAAMFDDLDKGLHFACTIVQLCLVFELNSHMVVAQS